MDVQQLIGTITERLSLTASVKQVYGDPVTAGDRTIIPIASVQYAFGAGGGKHHTTEGQSGGGAGGKVSATPCGALEITPQGTRFVPFIQPKSLGLALAVGALAGAVIASLAGSKRIEVIKRPGGR